MRSSLLIAVAAAPLLALTACTAVIEDAETGDKQSEGAQSSAQLAPFSRDNANISLPVHDVNGLPFQIAAASPATEKMRLLLAKDAVDPGQILTLKKTGKTVMPPDSMAGPSLRAIMSPDQIFAGQIMPKMDGRDFTDLSQIPTVLGVVDQSGEFVADYRLTEEISSLDGSNPEGLYFEPQDASVNGDWVVWREGSAGQQGAFPTMEFDDWRVVAWNRKTDSVKEYASAFKIHQNRHAPRAPWSGPPTTDGTFIYFNAAVPAQLLDSKRPEGQETQNWDVALLKTPLAKPGDVEVVAKSVASAAAPTGGVYWVENGAQVIYEGNPIFAIPTEGWVISSLAAGGSYLFAAVVPDTSDESTAGWIIAWNNDTGVVETGLESAAQWIEMSASSTAVAWGNGTASSNPEMFIWKRGDDAITAVGAAEGMSKPLVGTTTAAIPEITSDGAVLWDIYTLK